jgi:hypothetical protein
MDRFEFKLIVKAAGKSQGDMKWIPVMGDEGCEAKE